MKGSGKERRSWIHACITQEDRLERGNTRVDHKDVTILIHERERGNKTTVRNSEERTRQKTTSLPGELEGRRKKCDEGKMEST